MDERSLRRCLAHWVSRCSKRSSVPVWRITPEVNVWNHALDIFHRRIGDVPVQMVFCMTGWNGMSDGCRRTRVSVARASVKAWCRAGHDAKNAGSVLVHSSRSCGEGCGCNGGQYARDGVMRACMGKIGPSFVFGTQRSRALRATAEAVQGTVPRALSSKQRIGGVETRNRSGVIWRARSASSWARAAPPLPALRCKRG